MNTYTVKQIVLSIIILTPALVISLGLSLGFIFWNGSLLINIPWFNINSAVSAKSQPTVMSKPKLVTMRTSLPTAITMGKPVAMKVALPTATTAPEGDLPSGSFNVNFQPKNDGFGFRNYGSRYPEGKLTPNEARELFGNRVCSRLEEPDCIPIPENQVWVDTMNDYMAAGHCAGFTVASVRLFNKQLQPNQFTPNSKMTFEIQQNTPSMRQIAKDWVLQTTEEVMAKQVSGTPRQIIQALLTQSQPVDLGIFSRSGGGHSLLAYGVQDMGNGKYHILVYDNNWPGQDLYIEVDYQADTWLYSLAATEPTKDAKAWEGDAKTESLIFLPFEAYDQKVKCPFCTEETDKLAVSASGNQVTVQVTTTDGQKLGQVDEKGETLVEEVEGSKLFRIKDVMYEDRAPYLRLPMKYDFAVSLRARPNKPLAKTNLRMTGPGLAFAILGLEVPAGQVNPIDVSPTKQQISYKFNGHGSPMIETAQTEKGLSIVAKVIPEELPAGSKMEIRLDRPTGNVLIGGTGGEVDVILAKVNQDGAKIFVSDGVTVPTGGQIRFDLANWNGNGPMPVSLDLTGQGNFQPASVLNNVPMGNVIKELDTREKIINALSGIAPYLNTEQTANVMETLAQTGLSGLDIGKIIAELKLKVTPAQVAALIKSATLPLEQIADLITQLPFNPFNEAARQEIIAALKLSPAEAATLQAQLVTNEQLEQLLKEIEFKNFDTPSDLADFIAKQNLTPADQAYLIEQLNLPAPEKLILEQTLPTPLPTSTSIPTPASTPSTTPVLASPTSPISTLTAVPVQPTAVPYQPPATPKKPKHTATPSPTPTATPNPSPTNTPTPTLTATPTTAPTLTATPTTIAPLPTDTPTTIAPLPTNTPTTTAPLPTNTPTTAPLPTNTPTTTAPLPTDTPTTVPPPPPPPNNSPYFISTANTSANQNVSYSYNIVTADVDGTPLFISAPTLPTWLTLVDNGDGTAVLSGTPTVTEVGSYAVVLEVTDGLATTQQDFTIIVLAMPMPTNTPTPTPTPTDTPTPTPTTAPPVDAAPFVTSKTPLNGATGVLVSSSIVINFSESVNVTPSSFTLGCPAGIVFTISGSGTSSITLVPTANMPGFSDCQVTVIAANVTDVDAVDPPDAMIFDYSFSFTTQ